MRSLLKVPSLTCFAAAMLAFLLAGSQPTYAAGADVRIKDLVEFDGVRGNDLVGYGLVVGLPATGDGLRNSPLSLIHI